MIGQLINEFDELLDPTLADFNSTFRLSLEGDLKAPVKIGTMTVGGLREVFIGGKIELIELPMILDKARTSEHQVYKVMKKNKVVFVTHLIKNISSLLKVERRKVAQYCEQDRELYGHRIIKAKVGHVEYLKAKSNKVPSNYKVDLTANCSSLKLGRSSSYYYEYTSRGEKTAFQDIGSFIKATGIGRKTIEARVRNKTGLFGGWKVERFDKG